MTVVLASKVAVVSEAGSCIGLAIARRFATEGAPGGRRPDLSDGRIERLLAATGQGLGVRTDGSVQTDLDDLYSVVCEKGAASTCLSPTPAARASASR